MSCLTKLFFHTGTTSPTDIGPASGGVLHSLLIDNAFGSGDAVIKDGGSAGTVILRTTGGERKWVGIRLEGQLNIQLADANQRATIEMSELL